MTSEREFERVPHERETRDSRASTGAGDTALLWGVFTPPLAWSIDELTSITLHYDYCAALSGRTFVPWSGAGVMLTVVGVAMLGLSLVAGFRSWRIYAALGADTGRGATVLDRQRFMARAGLITCALFSFGIVLRVVAPFVLPASACGR